MMADYHSKHNLFPTRMHVFRSESQFRNISYLFLPLVFFQIQHTSKFTVGIKKKLKSPRDVHFTRNNLMPLSGRFCFQVTKPKPFFKMREINLRQPLTTSFIPTVLAMNVCFPLQMEEAGVPLMNSCHFDSFVDRENRGGQLPSDVF